MSNNTFPRIAVNMQAKSDGRLGCLLMAARHCKTVLSSNAVDVLKNQKGNGGSGLEAPFEALLLSSI
jgi:hypothetical protein